MANKEARRELQGRLAERLRGARLKLDTAAWLAVECAGQGLLLPLEQAGEIFPAGTLTAVAHTQPWFLGVANLRGRLHGVVDLAAFLGLRGRAAGEPGREHARLVALNPALDIHCALLVDRLAGLRTQEQMKDEPQEGSRPAFAGRCLADGAGRGWQELQLAALAGHEAFLEVGR